MWKKSFYRNCISTRLQINKKPAFQPISSNIYQQSNTLLYDEEKRLEKLLLEESEKVIETVKTDITREMDKKFPDSTDSERILVHEKHKRFKQILEIRRNRKWEKF